MGRRVDATWEPVMVDHSYRVRLKTQTVQHVIASSVQLYGDHLVFVNSNGQLAALFLKDLVHSWNMLPNVHGTPVASDLDSDPDGPCTLSTR
jgi:hypothetical protein